MKWNIKFNIRNLNSPIAIHESRIMNLSRMSFKTLTMTTGYTGTLSVFGPGCLFNIY